MGREALDLASTSTDRVVGDELDERQRLVDRLGAAAALAAAGGVGAGPRRSTGPRARGDRFVRHLRRSRRSLGRLARFGRRRPRAPPWPATGAAASCGASPRRSSRRRLGDDRLGDLLGRLGPLPGLAHASGGSSARAPACAATKTQPTSGTGLPPISRPSSNSQRTRRGTPGTSRWTAPSASALSAICSTNASPRPIAPAGGVTSSPAMTASSYVGRSLAVDAVPERRVDDDGDVRRAVLLDERAAPLRRAGRGSAASRPSVAMLEPSTTTWWICHDMACSQAKGG